MSEPARSFLHGAGIVLLVLAAVLTALWIYINASRAKGKTRDKGVPEGRVYDQGGNAS